MNDIQGIGSSRQVRVIRPQMTPTNDRAASAYTPQARADEVEISQIARYLSKVAMLPEVRSDKVEGIRAALAEDSYDVDGKLSEALDKLIDENM